MGDQGQIGDIILSSLWIEKVQAFDKWRFSLRIDWSNDRHQAIHLDDLSPESVEAGLFRAAAELYKERRREMI